MVAFGCCVLGHFRGKKNLTLYYADETVAQLPMDFLHHGLPQRVMEIKFEPYPEDKNTPDFPTDWISVYKQVLSHLNVCSKEIMLRQYDQTVQGRTVLSPF